MAASKSLVIVESPSKAKTINKFLGKEYKVTASVGHIIDLPPNRFGVNIEGGFKPEYIKIRGKEKIIKELKKEAGNSKMVYIATDPDREGEAIAWHIASVLDKPDKEIRRIEFNEITKNAVATAMNSSREIDMSRVYSQQARRVLDRIVGYQVSPLLWKTIYKGLSAGRVQSVALRLVCERESEIREFKPQEFWTIAIEVKSDRSDAFKAKLVKIFNGKKKKFEKATIANQKESDQHVANIKKADLFISEIIRKEVKKQPSPPFITSTLQQTAARMLGYSTRKIMITAQQLYEGIELPGKGSVGLITYMRTDSTRISNEALDFARNLIQKEFGEKYLPGHARVFKTKKSAQDAHEAIRPTYIDPEFAPAKIKEHLSRDQFKIYDLIWKRFLASQMQPAVFDKTIVEIQGDDYLFQVEGEVQKFDGFLKLYNDTNGNGENGSDENAQIPPGLEKDDNLKLLNIEPKQNFTKPPARFTESTLVKELDKLGIGRPSTYAQIITTILNRKYVEKIEKKLHATDLGETVNKILITNFPDIFNVKFTAEMEQELDKVAENEFKYEDIMRNFYTPFQAAMDSANEQKQQIKEDLQESTEEKCEKCGRAMVIKWGRNGKFLACSGFPECKNTKPLTEEEKPQETDEKCEKCGGNMVIKSGRFGRFMACSNYPTCKNTKPIPLGISCPKCGSDVVARKTKKGRTFYGCSKYPDCDFVSWNKPVNQACPECKNNYLLEKYTQAKGNFLQCPECKITIAEEKQ